MDAYVARQPIFDKRSRVYGYELLYRDALNTAQAEFVDGSKATSRLLSDAITLFGLPRLTDSKPAFVNFTDDLILNDFILLARPDEVMIELLETVKVTDVLVEKVSALRARGYKFCLDDYIGNREFEPLLPLVNILKVDFRLTSREEQRAIINLRRRHKGLSFLAEKVETREEFDWARKNGYQYFQGYFFDKPTTLKKPLPDIAVSSYGRILAELQRPEADLNFVANIIHADAVLTYRLMQRVQIMQYYRGNPINVISQALMVMGIDETRRWILLVLARDNNVTQSEELIREAYLRGTFAKRLMDRCGAREESENGFLLGMFSVLDKILGLSHAEILNGIDLPEPVKLALLGHTDNFFSRLLLNITAYEVGCIAYIPPGLGLGLSEGMVTKTYLESVVETDETFRTLDKGG